jgi:hypothetical protein
MFRLSPAASTRLSPEALQVCETFLGALAPFTRPKIRTVRLFGAQARRFEPEEPYDLLIVVDERSIEVRTSVAVAVSAAETQANVPVQVTVASAFEESGATGPLARLLTNAKREGVELWAREAR